MEQEKKELLRQQVAKLNEVLKTLEANFDVESDLADEFSFLSIVVDKLNNHTN